MVETDSRRISLLTGSTAVAMVFMVTVELMFFTGLFSAYIVNRATSRIPWPPPNLPQLPVFITGINTAILLFSAVLLTIALFNIKKKRNVLPLLWGAVSLGLVFVVIQGIEWVRLLRFGFTIESVGLFASFYYTLIGAHAFHAIAGILAGAIVMLQFTLKKDSDIKVYNRVGAMSFYWYFVVGIWPFIYYIIYYY